MPQNTPSPESTGQEALISVEEVVALTLTPEVEPVVDTRERANYLLESLGHLAATAAARGFQESKKTFGKVELDKMEVTDRHKFRGMGVRKAQQWREAKLAFLGAYNLGSDSSVDLDDNDFNDAFTQFNYRYGVGTKSEDSKRRAANRRSLSKNLQHTVKIAGPKATATPIAEVSQGVSQEEIATKTELMVAETKEKLIGLRDDERAGFLPTTHREKSQGFELLDYMDNPKYKEGVSTRLIEIFYRQQRELQKTGSEPREALDVANNSVQSVVHEWGDYYTNARDSWRKLHALGTLIDDTPNPNLTLSQLLEDEAQGEVVTQLIRYMCLRDMRDTDKPLGFDPLWVREDRENPTETKNKTVEDMFTHQNEQFMAAYVARYAERTTIKDVRVLVKEALHDQESRGRYWKTILESLNEDFKPYAQQALEASK